MAALRGRVWKGALALGVVLAVAGWANAQGRGGFGGGFGAFGGGGMDLLRVPEIRKELDVVEDQWDKIQQMNQDYAEAMRGMFSGLRDPDLSDEERREKMAAARERADQSRKKFEEKMGDVLLPHQRDRLKQIGLQNQLRFQGVDGALGSADLAKALGITDEQKKKLADARKEVEKEMQEKIAKVRKEGQDKILSVLNSEQRKKLEEMLGKEFTMPQPQFGGGAGGQGGNRGGGNRGGGAGGGGRRGGGN